MREYVHPFISWQSELGLWRMIARLWVQFPRCHLLRSPVGSAPGRDRWHRPTFALLAQLPRLGRLTFRHLMGRANAAPPWLLLLPPTENPPYNTPKPTSQDGRDEVSTRIKATLGEAPDLTAPLTIERSELAHYSRKTQECVLLRKTHWRYGQGRPRI